MTVQFDVSLRNRRIKPSGQYRAIVAGTSHGIGAGGSANNALINSYNDGIWDQMIMGAGHYDYLTNVAVGGSNAQACYDSLVLALPKWRPHVVFFDAPTNDLQVSMTDAQMTAVMQTIERIILLCLSNGAIPVFGFTPPRNGYGVSIEKLLPLCMELTRYYQTPFVDFYSPLIDQLTGNYATGNNVDGVHLSALGRSKMFLQYGAGVNNLALLLPGIYRSPVRNISTTGQWWNMVRNGNFLYQSTPGVPDHWTISTTGGSTYTVTDAATFPDIGNIFKYTKPAAAFQNTIGCTTAVTLAAAHTVQISGRVKAAGLIPATAAGWILELQTSNGEQASRWQNVKQNMDTTFCVEATWVASGIAGFFFYTSDIGTYELSSVTMWDKTAAQAIHTPGLISL